MARNVRQELKDYTGEKPSFWGAMAVPWEGTNPIKVGVISLVLSGCIMGIVFLILHLVIQDRKPSLWPLFLLPLIISVAITLFVLPVRFMVNRLANKLEGNALLRSHCMIVHGVIEKPGIVQVAGNELLIKPIVGEEIRAELSQITSISELRYYNGRPYVGTARFFKLDVPEELSKKGRLGFGVANANPWRDVLPING